ncbi:tRNA pseudouridine synthase A [Sulfuriferula plumbiphila]|uniref:tRNA pseudouridine synthase A n=1 Tax=Sulfuriferula plumbiphila TaxID=171865 RepID=A0A512L6E0_9PROT|nr:tRNA pseudouridine(38-40) synthase TruA [Sulfuriferula plumbiphila]BBP03642.1 tRNA pseudouridine synthase A [Sulfuriferula plumbiphila]GEP30043.1 tRNA pseudouridine synthase A [Sulfuriferula plumbiphila]
MVRIALGLEYDGRRFCGWQTQPDGCSVQDTLQRALTSIAGHAVEVVAAGRTDAGVHAAMQVVHFEAHSRRPESAWVRGVNSFLPDSVAVLWARTVPQDFHARFSALARSYRYVLLNHPVRPALQAGRVGWFHAPLALEPMREAAQLLVGTHDFSAFRAAACQAKSPLRELRCLEVRRHGNRIVFDLSANAFLHHMVRNIVGALVYVGKGQHPPYWVAELLQQRDRKLAAPTFAPDGLYLSAVQYAEEWGLPTAQRLDL